MSLAERIVCCRRCSRLRKHCAEVARVRRRAYRDHEYWGKPVPSFGSSNPELLVVGLAPGAHGANRTGRVFTGDPSGDWLFRALFVTGFANQAKSVARDDGLALLQATVSCAGRCAPPKNRPSARELGNCRPYLVEELETYSKLRVVIALGRIASEAVTRAWVDTGRAPFAKVGFAHGAETVSANGMRLLYSYHPSQQNTNTGRLTRRMFHSVFRRAREIVDG